jgi:hypothetical protein
MKIRKAKIFAPAINMEWPLVARKAAIRGLGRIGGPRICHGASDDPGMTLNRRACAVR